MTHLRRAALACAATAGLLLAPATVGTAWAGGEDGQLVGDVNGDGISDQAVLGGGYNSGDCFADVSLGLAGGGYGAPTRYTYVAADLPEYCPDMGVIADLNGDGTAEILLTRFSGLTGTILIFDSGFAPGMTFTAAQEQPSGIESADFNGDGLDDIYETTDQGDGISIFYGTAGGGLTVGPNYRDLWWFDYSVTDLDGDGRDDIVMGYRDEELGTSGVRVAFSGVQVVDLVHDSTGSSDYRTGVDDVSGDGRSDVTVTSYIDDAPQPVRHFITLPGRHELRPAPTVRDETITVRKGATVVVKVLANDSATTAGTVTIAHKPWKGTATVGADRQITFVAPKTKGVQHVLYAVTDDGTTVTGDLAIIVK